MAGERRGGLSEEATRVYAGFAFDFGGAIVSHAAAGDTLVQTLPALCCAALLAVSYGSYRARRAPALAGEVA